MINNYTGAILKIFTNSSYTDNISDKFYSKMRMEKLLSEINSMSTPLIKTASNSDMTDIIQIFAKALSEMKIKTEVDLGELFKRIISSSGTMEKNASNKDRSKEETIKIASKEVKDSHYQIDISKDKIEKSGMKLHMISVYARDAYLGRYLMKRNFYYLNDNEDGADETFDELTSKVRKVKAKYLEDKSTVNSILTDLKNILTGVISDMRFDNEDKVGTTVERN